MKKFQKWDTLHIRYKFKNKHNILCFVYNKGEDVEMRKIIKFEKNDCNPCAMVSDLLDKKGIEYERINPFDNPGIAVKYKIRSVPTVILFEENEEIKRTIGFKPEEINEIISMM